MSLCRLFNNTHQTSDITRSAFFSGYADQPQFVQPPPVTDDKVMSAIQTKHQDERPSRKLKSENRLYNFLTRSRSRSRSKNESTSTQPSTMPDVPAKSRTTRRTQNDATTESPGSKPPSRIQSRPLSSTTTTTNTTVTPATPKPKKQQQQQQQRPSTTSSALPPEFDLAESSPRPTTPRPSGARQKLHDFFSIPLGRKSSRSRSRSRPSSPRASLDIPPLPTSGVDDDPTPRPRKSYTPQVLPSQSPSPTPGPKVLRVTNATTTSSSTGSTAASIKISKFFTSSTPEPSLPKQPTPAGGPPILPPIPSFVSAPIRRVSSLHRRSVKDPMEPQAQSGVAQPKITHTPPTPLRNPSGSSSKGSNGSASGSGSQPPLTAARLGYHAVKGSLDSGYRYRGATMGVVSEEVYAAQHSSTGHYKGKSREGASSSAGGHDPSLSQAIPTPRTGLKMSKATRATKHGSFDFERPGWGVGVMQRAGSNDTTGTANSTWSKISETVNKEKERESTYGPGLAGVGTLQREVSMKRAQEREELLRMKEKRRQVQGTPVERERDRFRGKNRERERPPTASQRTTPGSTPSGSEHVQASTSAATGKTSSMSKATGRRALLHSGMGLERKTASGSGLTRLVGLMPAQHGPFSFEPPVPSPTRSTGTASTGTAHEVVLSNSWTNKTEKERERVRDEKERLTTRKNGNGMSRRSGDRAPVPVPTVPVYTSTSNGNAGHRSGTKGRSLDLGLGLSWAPSKVREAALLPSSGFFSRSLSGSSGGHHNMSRTASGSTTGRSGSMTRGASGNGNGRSRGNDGDMTRDVERSKLGKEVAEVFKSALNPEDYKLFKTYVHQFDAHEIPFDGPMGIVTLVENLLVSAPHLGDDGKRRLLDKFVRIILQQA
ncbi:hypothetical protein CVT25_010975 [Psilocybe cyanescens]|uniref:Uncharacterized protein n=1 Tax=Psilocybe cyanescens TaxID=93625 RepID=A0A409WFX8_PSICY|nr:hypothetical protein CVT25_010975 [Psilocybe cyanescens]